MLKTSALIRAINVTTSSLTTDRLLSDGGSSVARDILCTALVRWSLRQPHTDSQTTVTNLAPRSPLSVTS